MEISNNNNDNNNNNNEDDDDNDDDDKMRLDVKKCNLSKDLARDRSE